MSSRPPTDQKATASGAAARFDLLGRIANGGEHRAAGGRRTRGLLIETRYGWRSLLKQPGFTGIALLPLLRGIGANPLRVYMFNLYI